MRWPREIFALTSLRRLNVSFHGFRQLPPHIQQLAALEELIISNNPLLESLPGELALLPHLKGLSVKYCLLPGPEYQSGKMKVAIWLQKSQLHLG